MKRRISIWILKACLYFHTGNDNIPITCRVPLPNFCYFISSFSFSQFTQDIGRHSVLISSQLPLQTRVYGIHNPKPCIPGPIIIPAWMRTCAHAVNVAVGAAQISQICCVYRTCKVKLWNRNSGESRLSLSKKLQVYCKVSVTLHFTSVVIWWRTDVMVGA